jgi:hypothetical protein
MLDALKKLWKRFTGESHWIWIGAGGAVMLALGFFSVVDVEPGEVAVKVNNITGGQSVVTKPGWAMRLPLMQSVYLLDAKPHTFKMKGTRSTDDLHVRELAVRASDGSNFHFTDTTILFQIKGDMAVKLVNDAGLEHGYQHWMKPFARSILRDEFGRESTIHVSDPTTYGAAANRAKKRLNKQLAPHGLMVTQLVTPRPRFNQGYEKAIEDRNALSNQLEVIKSNLDRASTNRGRMLAEVNQKKNKIIQTRRAKLESDLATAVAEQSNVKRKVDTYRIGRIGDGQASLSAARQKAKELKGELAAKYVTKQAEIAAFRTQPVERVMERLGESLKGVTIDIQPYADDATPSRVKYQEVKPR